MTDARQVARVGGVATIVAGLGVGVLQLVQSLAGSFNPRWEVTALFAFAAFCATYWAQRFNARRTQKADAQERGAVVRRSLSAWPIPRLGQAKPEELGVFPARRDEESTAYAPRLIDTQLLSALEGSRLVVLIGPPRAGKSRTALHAAQDAFADEAEVIAPRDALALQDLLGVDARLEFEGLREVESEPQHRVLWLDGLERYVSALDSDDLDGLGRLDPPVTIVATMRREAWRGLLAADGTRAQTAKAIVARARVLELPLVLDPERELPQAKALYPGRDLSEGIGPALSSDGEERVDTQPAAQAGEDPPPGAIGAPGPVDRDALLVAPLLAGIAALAGVLIYLVSGHFEKPAPPSIADQVSSARRAGNAGPRTTVDFERADFHGNGEPSYFFSFGDEPGVPASRARSNEIQVWDRHGDKLEREFVFEPRALPERALFQFRSVGDVDGDGADELIGGYGTDAIPGELLLPFALNWDEDRDRYELVSLSEKPPELATRARGADVAGLRAAYRNRLILVDRRKEPPLAGYRSQDFTTTSNPHRLVDAYVADITHRGERRTIELQPKFFVRTGGRPRVQRCKLTDTGTITADVPSAQVRRLVNATLERWLEASKGRFCVP